MDNIELLKSMVKINTTNSTQNETELANFLGKYLKKYAQKIEYIGKKRKNLIAYFGNLQSNNILLLTGHMDTAEVDIKDWKTSPFLLTKREDLLYGRGVADMKGGLIICIGAILKAVQDNLLNDKQIIFVASSDEESGASSSYGLKIVVDYLLSKGIQPYGAILPEPNTYGELPRINYGHRGLIWLKVVSYGTQAHSGLMNKEDNAILNMYAFLSELQTKITNQPTKINGVPCTSARVTFIESQHKNNFNQIPSVCMCNIDVRTGPKDDNVKILNQIEKIAKKYGIKIDVIKNTPSSSITKNAKIVKDIKRAFELSNQQYTEGYSSPTCDAHWLNQKNIPTINGLGVNGGNVHGVDEFCEIKSIDKGIELFYNLIKIF